MLYLNYRYVDTILDLLLILKDISDLYKKPELIFLGPDENTASFVD